MPGHVRSILMMMMIIIIIISSFILTFALTVLIQCLQAWLVCLIKTDFANTSKYYCEDVFKKESLCVCDCRFVCLSLKPNKTVKERCHERDRGLHCQAEGTTKLSVDSGTNVVELILLLHSVCPLCPLATVFITQAPH